MSSLKWRTVRSGCWINLSDTKKNVDAVKGKEIHVSIFLQI